VIEKKITENGEHFRIFVASFSTQTKTGLDADQVGKI